MKKKNTRRKNAGQSIVARKKLRHSATHSTVGQRKRRGHSLHQWTPDANSTGAIVQRASSPPATGPMQSTRKSIFAERRIGTRLRDFQFSFVQFHLFSRPGQTSQMSGNNLQTLRLLRTPPKHQWTVSPSCQRLRG